MGIIIPYFNLGENVLTSLLFYHEDDVTNMVLSGPMTLCGLWLSFNDILQENILRKPLSGSVWVP